MKLTIFTPTYNRGYIIEQLYRSLQRQTCYDFEWLVVDDGSIDNTEELFSQWKQEETRFPIRYYRKENGGKQRAINSGLDLAQGFLFYTVDSDDYLTDDAVEKIIQWDQNLSLKEKYCGFAGNMDVSVIGSTNRVFEGGYYDGTALDRYTVVDGERAMVFYTEVHRKYKYPEFKDEKFVTEAVAWNRMAADGFRMRFYNDVVCLYEYQEDGLTKAGNQLFLNNPQGYGLWLREKAIFQKIGIIGQLKLYYTFTCELYEQHTCKQIAEFIGAPYGLICIYGMMRKLIGRIRK